MKTISIKTGLFLTAAFLLAACTTTVTETPVPSTVSVVEQTSPAAAPTEQPTAPTSQTSAGTADIFAYCQAVQNIDAPDARYTGDKVPPQVVDKLMRVYQPEDELGLKEMLQTTAVWRCMDGQVYTCSVGANLPCAAKINPLPETTAAMLEFCKENPNQDVIPAAVTGRETAFAWRCQNGQPVADRQVISIDPRGFDANIWYRVNPNQPDIKLVIENPTDGSQVQRPVIISGTISQMPFEKNLIYRVTNLQGEEVLIGPIQVEGEYGETGKFEIEIPFTTRHRGEYKIKILDLSAEDGSLMAGDSLIIDLQ